MLRGLFFSQFSNFLVTTQDFTTKVKLMGFKCGIVGLPNVGKSSLFNALTRSSIAAENYPFCTIDPNIGVVPVPDPRLDKLAGLVQPGRHPDHHAIRGYRGPGRRRLGGRGTR